VRRRLERFLRRLAPPLLLLVKLQWLLLAFLVLQLPSRLSLPLLLLLPLPLLLEGAKTGTRASVPQQERSRPPRP